MKIYQLKNIKQCPFKGYISQFDFKTSTNKSLMLSNIYKDIVKEYDFLSLTEIEIKNIILNKINDDFFLTKQEKEVEVVTILTHLIRYFNYEKILNRKILKKDIKGIVKIDKGVTRMDKASINVKADIVFETNDTIELVKFRSGATKLSYKAKKEDNKPENDIELFLMKKLGEKIYHNSNKKIISSFYHFKGKSEDKDIYKKWIKLDDNVLKFQAKNLTELKDVTTDKKEKKAVEKQIKKIKDVLFFDNSKGNNIITFDYDKDLSEEILELANKELSIDSEKCKSNDCDFCDYSVMCNHKKTKKIKLKKIKKTNEKSNSEIKLTKEQQQVTEIENGIYRINAVAGAGKSFTMVMRTINLLKKGCSLNDILMITFTNKGAEELKEKINNWANVYKIDNANINANIFTFNSFGGNIIANEWSKLRFTKQPEIASTVDTNDTIKELLEDFDAVEWLNYKAPLLNFPNAKGAFIQLKNYFNLIKSFNYNKEGLIKNVIMKEKTDMNLEETNNKAAVIFEMYDSFNKRLLDKNLLQYQDQILYLTKLLKENPNLIERYGYKHIVVDEYQDTDFAQIELLHILNKYNKFQSLIVVGDSSQSIYSFKNTTPENILNFDKEFDNVKDIFLLENFRSSPEICNVANKLDKINTKRIDKEIFSNNAHGENPSLTEYETLDDEYSEISNIIEDEIKKGTSKHEISVIARTKKELLEIQKVLDNKNIPNIVEASESYIDNNNVKHILNLAKFFKNNELDYYILENERLKNNGIKNFGSDVNEIIKAQAENIVNEITILENEEEKIMLFKILIATIILDDEVAKSFTNEVFKKTFYTFNEFLTYLQKISLYKDDTKTSKDEEKYDAITLTTAHSSKGKEWDVVINTINKYKYKDIIDNLDALEEERRLLFVSITRAKKSLFIMYNTNQDKSRNKGKYCMFADELKNIMK